MSYPVPDASNIPPLTGHSNYHKWALEVRAVAMCCGLWGAFTGANTAPTDADAAQLECIAECEMKAQGLILVTSSYLLREELMSLKIAATAATATAAAVTRDPSAQDMWDHLESRFQKKDAFSAFLDIRLFLRATLTDDGTLEAQLNKLTELRAAAATSGFTVEDWQFASIMLIALPQSYEHIKYTLLATDGVTTLNPAAVRSCILETEARHNTDPSTGGISLSAGNSNNNKKGKGKRPPKPPPGVGDCWHCGKPGHWANRCKEKPRQSNNQVAGPSNQKGRDKGPSNPNVATSTTFFSEQCESSDWSLYIFGAPENWLFDDGASDHYPTLIRFCQRFTRYCWSLHKDTCLNERRF